MHLTKINKGLFMTVEYTFSIIKPDATERNLTGKINSYLEAAGLEIIAQRRILMTKKQAETLTLNNPSFNL